MHSTTRHVPQWQGTFEDKTETEMRFANATAKTRFQFNSIQQHQAKQCKGNVTQDWKGNALGTTMLAAHEAHFGE